MEAASLTTQGHRSVAGGGLFLGPNVISKLVIENHFYVTPHSSPHTRFYHHSTMSFIDRATQLISDAPALLSELESERAAVFGSAKMSEVRRSRGSTLKLGTAIVRRRVLGETGGMTLVAAACGEGGRGGGGRGWGGRPNIRAPRYIWMSLPPPPPLPHARWH